MRRRAFAARRSPGHHQAKSNATNDLHGHWSSSGHAGANVDQSPHVIQLTVRLVAVPDRVDDLIDAFLRAVMRPALQLAGCQFAQVYRRPNDPRRIDYVEEWDDMAALRPHLNCERFGRLLELIELAVEAPEFEFRYVSETHGIDYLATQRAALAIESFEPGDH